MSHTGMHEAFESLRTELASLKLKHQKLIEASVAALNTYDRADKPDVTTESIQEVFETLRAVLAVAGTESGHGPS